MTEQVQAFTPDWVSPLGETIADLSDERHWTRAELAEPVGFTRKYVKAQSPQVLVGIPVAVRRGI